MILHIFFKKYRYRKSKSVHFKRSTGTELLLGASTEYRYRLTFKVPMPTFVSRSTSEEVKHLGSVLSPLLFAMVIDEVTENARQGWMKQILYADDFVLIGETKQHLRENFDE